MSVVPNHEQELLRIIFRIDGALYVYAFEVGKGLHLVKHILSKKMKPNF